MNLVCVQASKTLLAAYLLLATHGLACFAADWSSFDSEKHPVTTPAVQPNQNQQEQPGNAEQTPFSTSVLDPFKEIEEAFHRNFKLGTGPTPQLLLHRLEPRESVLKRKLKEDFRRYGTLAVQYACYTHPQQAMEVYDWLDKNRLSVLDPDDPFFKRISINIGLYLYVQGDYTDSVTCLENGLKEPVFANTPRQKVAASMACFGLADSYNKLGDADKAQKYLAKGRDFNEAAKAASVPPSPPPAVPAGPQRR